MYKKIAATLSIAALAQSVTAQTPDQSRCMSVAQAEALVIYILPTAVKASRNACAAALPASEPLLQENSEQLARYEAASENAWPEARDAVTLLAGEDLPPDTDEKLLRTLANATLSQMIESEIKPKDCGLIGKIYSDLEPMPSANLASLTITIVQAATKDDEKQDIPICKPPA